MQVAMQERPTRPPLLAQPWRPPTPSVAAPPTPPTESTPAPTDERMRELIMIRHLEYQLNKEREERRLADETRLEHRRQATASKATAADIARAASACPHNGDVEKGLQWWSQMRGLLRRLSEKALEVAECDSKPNVDEQDENKLIYEVAVASINLKSKEGENLLRLIRQQNPSIVDDGWATRRLMCDVGQHVSTLEANAIYSEIALYTIDLDANKASVLAVAHCITEKWLKLPTDRKGHSRRNVEMLLEAVPEAAVAVRDSVQSLCDAAESMDHPLPDINMVAGYIYTHMARWRANNKGVHMPRAHVAQGQERSAGRTRPRDDKMPCANCGTAGHHPRDCKHKCSTEGCGVSYCGTGHGKKCPLTLSTMPTNDKVLTFHDKPLMGFLYKKLTEKHKAKHDGTGGQRTNAAFDEAPFTLMADETAGDTFHCSTCDDTPFDEHALDDALESGDTSADCMAWARLSRTCDAPANFSDVYNGVHAKFDGDHANIPTAALSLDGEPDLFGTAGDKSAPLNFAPLDATTITATVAPANGTPARVLQTSTPPPASESCITCAHHVTCAHRVNCAHHVSYAHHVIRSFLP